MMMGVAESWLVTREMAVMKAPPPQLLHSMQAHTWAQRKQCRLDWEMVASMGGVIGKKKKGTAEGHRLCGRGGEAESGGAKHNEAFGLCDLRSSIHRPQVIGPVGRFTHLLRLSV